MQEVPVNVFWDIENCAVPASMKGVQVVNAIRSFALQRGILKNISAFANLKLIRDELRADLQESGVLLHDVTRKSNSSDLAILVEILKLVIDNKPPHCIVLISGDRDFANIISTLTFRKYQVYLIHSPQASEVLRNAATDAFEWTQLLKRGGDTLGSYIQNQALPSSTSSSTTTSSTAVSQVSPSPFDKFQPLLDFLAQKGKPQVEWSELGNLIPFARFGYPKLKDYILDAQNAGLVKCGANKNIHWVGLVLVNTPSPLPTNGPTNGSLVPKVLPDRKQILSSLRTALDSLKQDYFKPTEGTIQKRIKQLSLPLQKVDWEEIVSVAQSSFYIVEGEKPNRTIYPPAGPFEGADPSNPCSDKFSPSLWSSLEEFLHRVHPVVRTGRYGFAVFLQAEGPAEIREMPLGTLTELVQLCLHRHLLQYHKTQVSTVSPDEIPQSIMDYPPPSSPPDDTPLDGVPADEEDNRSQLVGVTFVWPYVGKSVLVTGSFFHWRNTIALHCYGEPRYSVPGKEYEPAEAFSTVLYLPPGKYEYKFVVDGAWHYDPKQPVVTDETGNLNNFIVVEPLPQSRVTPLNSDNYF